MRMIYINLICRKVEEVKRVLKYRMGPFQTGFLVWSETVFSLRFCGLLAKFSIYVEIYSQKIYLYADVVIMINYKA